MYLCVFCTSREGHFIKETGRWFKSMFRFHIPQMWLDIRDKSSCCPDTSLDSSSYILNLNLFAFPVFAKASVYLNPKSPSLLTPTHSLYTFSMSTFAPVALYFLNVHSQSSSLRSFSLSCLAMFELRLTGSGERGLGDVGWEKTPGTK